MLARALLAATSVVVLAFPALVVIGGLLPSLPTVGRFGAFIVGDLAWIGVGAVVALLLAAVALALGGGFVTRALVLAALVVNIGVALIGAILLTFATQHGASLSIERQLSPPTAEPGADGHIAFANVEGQTLRADIWRPATENSVAANRGTALVFVHGGAFAGGSLGSRGSLFESLSADGITVIDVEYRLTPPPRWADAPADVLCALAWLRASASALGVDPTRVVVMGESAGGSLALVAGYGAGSDLLAPSCPGEPVVPVGVIAISPAADLAGIWEDRTLTVDDRPFPESYVGGTPAEFPDRYNAASPFRLIRPGLPPTLIVTGANDHLVLPIRVTTLADQLKGGGVDTTLIVVPFADHGFDGSPTGFGAQLLETVVPDFVSRVTG